MSLFVQSFHSYIGQVRPKDFVLQNYAAISGNPVIIFCFRGNPNNRKK